MNTDLERAHALSERLVAARADHRRAEHALAVLLAELVADQLFRPLGYASVEEFAADRLDLTARQTRDLVRIGRALPRLPRLDAALAAGELDWTKAREIVRVATEATEAEWIQRAKEVPSRVLERLVAARNLGESPPEAGDPAGLAPALRTLVARMESADYDMVRVALAAMRADLDADTDALGDGDLLARIVEQWLHTRKEHTDDVPSPGHERYRVTIEHCPSCGGNQLADAEVSDTVIDEARCDAEVVDLRPGPKQGHVSRTVPPAIRRMVMARAKWRCEVPGCRSRLWLDIHHLTLRSEGGTHDPRGLVCLCSGHHRSVHRGYLGIERSQDGRVQVVRAPQRCGPHRCTESEAEGRVVTPGEAEGPPAAESHCERGVFG